jgi:hypothetical protein
MNILADKFAARLFRFKPFGKGADDPLSTLKSATRWAESLPTGDTLKSQHAVLTEVKRFNEDLTQLTKNRLSVLMLMDEKSTTLQDTMVRQYLRNPRMSRAVESQSWHNIYALYWELARAYHAFILDFAYSAGKSPNESLIPLITLRAIHIFGLLLKWRAIRYLQSGEKIWLRLHNLYRIAENEGFHQRKQKAYPEDNFESSCESAYLHILMLNLANSGTLYPRQIDLVDSWLENWHETMTLDRQVNSSIHNFAIDLSADHGPRRVRNTPDEKPMRFWSTAALLEQLKNIQFAIREGTSTAQLGLTDNVRTAESIELLEHLQRQWSPLSSREQRRHPREPTKHIMDLTHGLGNIISQIKSVTSRAKRDNPYCISMPYAEEDDVSVYGFITERTQKRTEMLNSMPSVNSPDVERWVMHDESKNGYGSVVETRDKDWLRVGTLVATKPHTARNWRIGVIRRLSRLSDESSSVGIEALSSSPRIVMLYRTDSSSAYTVDGFDNSGAKLPLVSLWLEGDDGAATLIIDSAHFQPGKVFEVQGLAKKMFVSLGYPIERSEGWMRIKAEPVNGQ